MQLGAFVFQAGLLQSAGAGDIGFHEHTLADTLGRPAERVLEQAGVRVLLGWRARGLARTASGFELLGGSGRDGEDGPGEGPGLSAEAVLVALPHERAASLLEPTLGDQTAAWRQLGSSPIVNLHLLYDRSVLEEPFVAGRQDAGPVRVRSHPRRRRAPRQPVPRRVPFGGLTGDGDERRAAARALRPRPAGAAAADPPGAPGAVPGHA